MTTLTLGAALPSRRKNVSGGGGFTTITDSFNRANGAIGSTDTGQVWTSFSGTWEVDTNQAKISSAGGTQNHVVVESTVSDCTITATMAVGDDGGLCFRASDDNNLFVTSGLGGQLYRRTAGGFTSIGTFASFSASDVMRIVLSGTSISVFKNGVLGVAVTDSQGTTNTKHGLRIYAFPHRIDNFSITVP